METRKRTRDLKNIDDLLAKGFITEFEHQRRKEAILTGRGEDHFRTTEDSYFPSTSSFDGELTSSLLSSQSGSTTASTGSAGWFTTQNTTSQLMTSQTTSYTYTSNTSTPKKATPIPAQTTTSIKKPPVSYTNTNTNTSDAGTGGAGLWGGIDPWEGMQTKKWGDIADEEDRKKAERAIRFSSASVSASVSAKSEESAKSTKSSTSTALEIREPTWRQALAEEMSYPYYQSILEFIDKEAKTKTIFPPRDEIFSALELTPLNKVKVVIIGQDPYHDDGQAHGLCFSVKPNVAVPPSLKNMYRELTTDVPGFRTPSHGCLVKWAMQGVLLLNATLTVEAHQANSHAKIGWQKFTDKIIRVIDSSLTGVVFILLGGFAQKKGAVVNQRKHCVLNAAHPSPLSASKFYGCKVFSEANKYLINAGKTPIDWQIDADPMYPPPPQNVEPSPQK